jgi:hypothetical protein
MVVIGPLGIKQASSRSLWDRFAGACLVKDPAVAHCAGNQLTKTHTRKCRNPISRALDVRARASLLSSAAYAVVGAKGRPRSGCYGLSNGPMSNPEPWGRGTLS